MTFNPVNFAAKTWADGDKPDWKEYKTEIFDVLEFLMNPPMCWVKANADTTMNSGVWTAINFQVVLIDMPGTQAMFNTVTPTRVTPKTPGRYKVLYGASWAGGTCGCSGRRLATVRKNGVHGPGRLESRPASATSRHTVHEGMIDYFYMNGTTDYIDLAQYWDDTGSTTNGSSGDDWQSSIYVRWVNKY